LYPQILPPTWEGASLPHPTHTVHQAPTLFDLATPLRGIIIQLKSDMRISVLAPHHMPARHLALRRTKILRQCHPAYAISTQRRRTLGVPCRRSSAFIREPIKAAARKMDVSAPGGQSGQTLAGSPPPGNAEKRPGMRAQRHRTGRSLTMIRSCSTSSRQVVGSVAGNYTTR